MGHIMRGSILLFKHQGKFILFCLTMMMCVLFSNVSRASYSPLVAAPSLTGLSNNYRAPSSLPLMSTALLIASSLIRNHLAISDLASLNVIPVNGHSVLPDSQPLKETDSLFQEQNQFYRQFLDLIKSYGAPYRTVERTIPPHRIMTRPASPTSQKAMDNEDSLKSEMVRREKEARSFSGNRNSQLDENYYEGLEVTCAVLDNEEVIEIPSSHHDCFEYIQGIHVCGVGSSKSSSSNDSNEGQTSSVNESGETDYVICTNANCNATMQAYQLDTHLQRECRYRIITCFKCETPMRAYQLDKHQEKTKCGYKSVICPNEGCTAPMWAHQLNEHQKECGYRTVTCPNEGCGASVRAYRLRSHTRYECQFRVVKCTNEGCDTTMPPEQLETHRKSNCIFRLALCPRQCGTSIHKAELEQHLATECPMTWRCPLCLSYYPDNEEGRSDHQKQCFGRTVMCDQCDKSYKFYLEDEHKDYCPTPRYIQCPVCLLPVFAVCIVSHHESSCPNRSETCSECSLVMQAWELALHDCSNKQPVPCDRCEEVIEEGQLILHRINVCPRQCDDDDDDDEDDYIDIYDLGIYYSGSDTDFSSGSDTDDSDTDDSDEAPTSQRLQVFREHLKTLRR